jgi:hypothetical protein
LQERDAAGNWSKTASFTITIDVTGPGVPVVRTDSVTTNNQKPTWTWETGGNGGIGQFRYKLDNADLTNGATETMDKRFQPVTNLAEGTHTLYVQEMDAAKNWSANGLRTVTIDITLPSPPKFSNTIALTNNKTPTWSWVSGGGRRYYKYRLDDPAIDGAPSYTYATSYTYPSELQGGRHVLYIKEQDAAGNWSTSASQAIEIDLIPPKMPIVSRNFPKGGWKWETGGGGGCGIFRYKLDSDSWSPETNKTEFVTSLPSSWNTKKTYIFYVQERDVAGNWSESGSYPITVCGGGPNC